MEKIRMPWSADYAMRQLWAELDKGGSNGKAQALFRRHLQAAYDAGKEDQLAWDCKVHAQMVTGQP